MKLAGLILLTLIQFQSFAQSPADRKIIRIKEDSLKVHAWKLIQSVSPLERVISDSLFTKTFVRALKVPHSFNYPFDSLETISRIYPPDSSFRIFTWQLVVNENVVRQHGAIQMKTSDGSLKLFPLIDKSDITANMSDTIGNHLGWMGAVYYKMIAKQHNGKTYYTLLGYDENNIRSNKKIIEILDFQNGQPVFGSRIFNTSENKTLPQSAARYVMEYKRASSPRLTYDPELDMIVMEHLISQSNEPQKKYTLIGDGDYEGWKWKDGKWNYVTKVFNMVTPENQPPTPALIRDADGNVDESKLVGAEKEEAPKKDPKKKDR